MCQLNKKPSVCVCVVYHCHFFRDLLYVYICIHAVYILVLVALISVQCRYDLFSQQPGLHSLMASASWSCLYNLMLCPHFYTVCCDTTDHKSFLLSSFVTYLSVISISMLCSVPLCLHVMIPCISPALPMPASADRLYLIVLSQRSCDDSLWRCCTFMLPHACFYMYICIVRISVLLLYILWEWW